MIDDLAAVARLYGVSKRLGRRAVLDGLDLANRAGEVTALLGPNGAGLSNKDIARRLGLSPGTVRNDLSEAAGGLGAANRIEAGRTARANGWF